MRATKAYIASLGTTGVLIASSLLLLALVSAIVAFRGWPELEAHDETTPGLIIDEAREPVEVSEVRIDDDRDVRDAPGSRSGSARERGGDRDESSPGDGGTGGGGSDPTGRAPGGGGRSDSWSPAEGVGVAPAVPDVPQQLPRTTDDVRNGLSDLTERTTKGIGDTLGGVNPNLGAPFTETGRQLGGALETVPGTGSEPLPGVPLTLP